MALLSTIISSVLRDIVLAQHEANIYAISLEDMYKKYGRLERFALPAIAMGEVDFELQYGVTEDTITTEQYEINYPQLNKLTLGMTLRLARVALGAMLPVLQKSFPNNGEEAEKLLEKLANSIEMQEQYSTFLGRKILQSVQEAFTTLINDDGTVNTKILMTCTTKACVSGLLYHHDLLSLFNRKEGKEVREEAKGEMEKALTEAMPKIVKDVNLKRKRILPSMEVTVNSEELAKMPDTCIHTLKFHVSPNDIRFLPNEEQ